MIAIHELSGLNQSPPAASPIGDTSEDAMTKEVAGAELIIGHGNRIHDPAVAWASGDALFAESCERHVQNKRALCTFGLFYSSRAIQTGAQR